MLRVDAGVVFSRYQWKVRTVFGGRGKNLLCDPGSELWLGSREKRGVEITKELEKDKDKKRVYWRRSCANELDEGGELLIIR